MINLEIIIYIKLYLLFYIKFNLATYLNIIYLISF